MMRRPLILLLSLVMVCLWMAVPPKQSAQADEESGRRAEIIVPYTQYEWWLLRWANNELVCQLYTDHEGLPTALEVISYCGENVYQEWRETPPCAAEADDVISNTCQGLYAHYISSQPKERTVTVELPQASVWLTLSGCEAKPLENRCPTIPSLLFMAEEPLPNEHIVAINGIMDGEPFSCQAEKCELPLKVTSPQGMLVEFWADSSYGDSSQHYQAQVRVVDAGVSRKTGKSGWYVDILSSQWRGKEAISSCAECWSAFPTIGEPPLWLSSPDRPEALISTEPFVYLAGRLIASGEVDASDCPSGGLLTNGWANACGLGKASAELKVWQNRFNREIIEASRQSGVPAQLIKNIFAQESQFWPSALRTLDYPEYGFGHMTEHGADTVLRWNDVFFSQFCPLVISEAACSKGYALLGADDQALLRGALIMAVDTDCPDCPTGVNLTQTGLSIQLFAKALQASCQQVRQIILNITAKTPGTVASYEDLWRFVLVNYHAGPGCLYNAMQSADSASEKLTWANVSKHLEPGCSTAINFVERVTNTENLQRAAQGAEGNLIGMVKVTQTASQTPSIGEILVTPTPTPQAQAFGNLETPAP